MYVCPLRLHNQTEFCCVKNSLPLPCFQSFFVSEQIYRRCPADISVDVRGAKGKKLSALQQKCHVTQFRVH